MQRTYLTGPLLRAVAGRKATEEVNAEAPVTRAAKAKVVFMMLILER